MTVKLGVVMDPIGGITPKKDSTLAMLLEAQRRGWAVSYIEWPDLMMRDGVVSAAARSLEVKDDSADWFRFTSPAIPQPLSELDAVLMRRDPPFSIDYVYATQLLEQVERTGTLVVNRPGALRDLNEKLSTAWFPECCPPTLVTRRIGDLRQFTAEQGRVVLKPLDSMGGSSIFVVGEQDPNLSVVLEVMTRHGSTMIMAQRYIPEISSGDKRILLVDGEPVPYALARVPKQGETRGNLAAGATGEGRALTERDRAICSSVGGWLAERGLLFVGLDVIGDYLTEINVTSPTGIRELDKHFALNIAGTLFDALERRLARSPR